MLLDSRPSDAIALALREDAPILAAEAAFARSPQSAAPDSGERAKP
jgi:bifunctional DNase/RNase